MTRHRHSKTCRAVVTLHNNTDIEHLCSFYEHLNNNRLVCAVQQSHLYMLIPHQPSESRNTCNNLNDRLCVSNTKHVTSCTRSITVSLSPAELVRDFKIIFQVSSRQKSSINPCQTGCSSPSSRQTQAKVDFHFHLPVSTKQNALVRDAFVLCFLVRAVN